MKSRGLGRVGGQGRLGALGGLGGLGGMGGLSWANIVEAVTQEPRANHNAQRGAAACAKHAE